MKLSRKAFLKGAGAVFAASAIGMSSSFAAEETPAAPVTVDEVLDCDVCVVGLGVTGSVCAAKAGQMGAKVIGLDPALSIVGTNACGIFGTCTVECKEQKKYEGYITQEEFFTHIYKGTHLQSNGPLLSHMVASMGPAADIMMESGITFMYGFLGSTPADNLDYRIGIVFEKAAAERGAEFQGMLDKHGVDCRWNTRATSLITDADGKVVGVYAEDADGKTYQINAKGGVCLCTGGFIHNKEMVDKYFAGCEMMSISNSFVDGSGIRMAQEVGAQIGKNFSISLYEFSGSHPNDPKTGFNSANDILYILRIGNLILNRNGKRFVDEGQVATQTMFCGEPLIREGGRFYLVTDSKLLKEMSEKTMRDIMGAGVLDSPNDKGGQMLADFTFPNIFEDAEVAIEQGYCWKADTLEELSEKSGVPGLAETVATYNGYCAAGADPELYKKPNFLRPIEEGPFYIVECKLNAWVTLGGIKTDKDCRALDNEGHVIEGLYCGGSDCDAWGVPYYQVTTTSGFGFATGYISGEAAALRAKNS